MSETRSPELALALKRPFAEQVAFFRGKLGNLVPTAKWDELWKAQHDRAFMVAGAAKADLLADLAGAVDKAIAEGETLEQFRKRFRQIVTDRGWHGWTGEGTKAGEAWRTRVIYETNLITSYSAGRLEQLRAGGYRYWMYKHSDSRNPRPHHRALDGVVLPADDPFWQTHYPPNGWGCRCRAVGVDGPRSAQRLGGNFNKPLPRGWNTIDPKTGEPVGIDKGWGYMPGATWRPFDKHAFTPECGGAASHAQAGKCIRALPEQKTFADLGRPRLRDVPTDLRLPTPELLPRAASRKAALEQLAGELGVSQDAPRRWVETKMTVPTLDKVLVDYGYLAHMVEKDVDARERYARFVLPTLTDPYEAWATRYDDGTIRSRLIGLFEGKRQLAVIVRLNRDGSLFFNMMNADDRRLDAFRTGALLHGK